MKEHSEYRKRREDLMRDRKRIFLEGREQCTLTLHVYAYHAPKVCVFIVEENVNIGFALQKVLSGNACPMFSCAKAVVCIKHGLQQANLYPLIERVEFGSKHRYFH